MVRKGRGATRGWTGKFLKKEQQRSYQQFVAADLKKKKKPGERSEQSGRISVPASFSHHAIGTVGAGHGPATGNEREKLVIRGKKRKD